MTPEQLQTLAHEVANDPLGKGYQQHLPLSPGQVVDLLNAQTETMVKPIPSSSAKVWAAAGPYAGIVDAANLADHPCRASCLVVRETFKSGDDIHLDQPEVLAMFDAWVATNVITQAEHDALLARATAAASRAEVLGLPAITEYDLIEAGVQA